MGKGGGIPSENILRSERTAKSYSVMNTITNHYYSSAFALCFCASFACASLTSVAIAQDAKDARATSSDSSTDRAAETEEVRVTRASNFIGSDVMSTDGRKVGDIVDYHLDMNSAPHLAYVVIMTGGFLDMGGDRRAVPASAVTTSGDNCRISISSQRFWDVPVLPNDAERFISDAQNRQQIDQFFGQWTNGTTSSGRSGTTHANADSGTNTRSGNTNESGPGKDVNNRSGSMARSSSAQGDARLVSFNALRNAEAFGPQDTRLGFFVDAWISLNENRAPYVEVTPTFLPFRTRFDRRFAIPTAKLQQKREYYGYTVNVTTDELNKADFVSETEGVKMLEQGRFGNTVLRVTVPDKI